MRRTILLGLLLSGLAMPAEVLAADGAAALAGTLNQRTAGAALAPSTKLFLYRIDGQGAVEQAGETTADPSGGFAFAGLEVEAASGWRVAADYQGAPYLTDVLRFAPGETAKQVRLDVYEPSSDDSRLSIAATSLLIDADASRQELEVVEVNTFVNPMDRTFVPSTQARGSGPPPLLRFWLPANATDVAAGDGLQSDLLIQVSGGFGALVPLPPGQQQLSFSYRSAYQQSAITFARSVNYPTAAVRILIPAGRFQVDSPQLVRQARQTIGGRQYDLLAGPALPAGSKLEVRFSSLPGISPLTWLAAPEGLPWLAMALAVIVVALLIWYVRDRLRSRKTAPADAAPGLAGLWVRRRELLVAMALLDDRHDSGGLDVTDYRLQRDEYKAELRQVIAGIQALRPGEGQATVLEGDMAQRGS